MLIRQSDTGFVCMHFFLCAHMILDRMHATLRFVGAGTDYFWQTHVLDCLRAQKTLRFVCVHFLLHVCAEFQHILII